MTDHTYFLIKGLVAFSGLMIYAGHLWQIRSKKMDVDQVARFISLYLGGVSVFYASLQQMEQNAEYESRHLVALAFVISLNIAAILSIYFEWHKKKKKVHEKRLHGA